MAGQVDVAIGALVEQSNGTWRVLIARRPDELVLGGYWELPGGKVEPDEAADQCVAREFLEELGVQVAVGEALPVIEHEYEHAHVRLHPFLCSKLSGEPKNLEVAEHRWVPAEDLDDYRFPQANTELIQQVKRHLLSR